MSVPIDAGLHQATTGLLNGVSLLKQLQLRRGSLAGQFLQTSEDVRGQNEIFLEHRHLLSIHGEVITELLAFQTQFNVLELKIVLKRLHLGLKRSLLLFTRFGVQFHQHLPGFHLLPLLHQDFVSNAPDRHLNVLHRADRLQLSCRHDDLFGSRESQPGHTEHRGADQRPCDGAHPEAPLLKHGLIESRDRHRFAVHVLHTVGRLRQAGGIIAFKRVEFHGQASPCWRYRAK